MTTTVSTDVPTDVVVGGTRAQRMEVIARWLGDAHQDEPRLVVIAPAILGAASLPVVPGARTAIVEAPQGCACCVGNVMFRVFLTRLLREKAPRRLLLELTAGDHVDAIIAMLRDEWFSKVLAIHRVERLTSN